MQRPNTSDYYQEKKKKRKVRTKTNTTATNGGGGGGGGGGGELEDLISKLPDSLIHHILSYLDMFTVIQTCFLSRRWRYVWSSLPFLNFDYKVYYNLCSKSEECFLFFVSRALVFRNQNSNIHSFHVCYCSSDDIIMEHHTDTWIRDDIIEHHTDTWIHVLIRSNIQVIDLQFDFEQSHITLPISLFTCKSLTTLKLDMQYWSLNLPPPAPAGSMVCLPALKTLHLKSLWLEKSVEMLFSRSPVLETLIIYNCRYGSQGLAICNAQLKSLVIERTNSCAIDQWLNVSAPELTSFSAIDYLHFSNHYYFVNVPSLANVEIDFHHENEREFRSRVREENIKNVLDCLRGIYNVKSLMISAWLLELAHKVPERLESLNRYLMISAWLLEPAHKVPERLESLQIIPFCNLSLLKLNTSFSKHQICAITYFLEKCPNLETLVLKTTDQVKSVSVEEECWNVDLAPQYMMRNLKLVEIWDVLASANELEFLKFLLKNSIVLEKMIVFTSQQQSPNNYKSFRRFGEKLLSFRGVSSSIGILFV